MADDAHEKGRFRRASLVNVLGNAIKIIVEGIAGLTFGSAALVADAAHSIADLVASLVVFVWGGRGYDDADPTHPHGHQRIEPLTALFVGAVIVLLGGNILYDSGRGLLYGTDVSFSWILVGALGFAIVDMYLVYRYTQLVNLELGSTALAALAVDCRNDIYTTIAALVGVLGVLLDVPRLDPLAGAFVSLLVIWQGIDIARENVRYLSGAAPPSESREDIETMLLSHPEVNDIHDLAVYYDGPSLEVEVHVEVDGGLTLLEAHDIETRLIENVRSIEEVSDVHVHLDPEDRSEWPDESS